MNWKWALSDRAGDHERRKLLGHRTIQIFVFQVNIVPTEHPVPDPHPTKRAKK
jgi:hypothetical protein